MVFTFIYMKKGFTLIELLVSLSIFMLISGLMLANFRAGDHSNELQKSAEVLQSRIREAQTRAISGVGGAGVNGVDMKMRTSFQIIWQNMEKHPHIISFPTRKKHFKK